MQQILNRPLIIKPLSEKNHLYKNKNINKEKTDGITKPQIDISPANIKFARCIEAAMLNTIPAIFLIFIIA